MPRRTRRSDLPPDLPAVLDALGACRRRLNDICARTTPFGPCYRAALDVADAIDRLAELLTGDREHFWAGGSVDAARGEAIRRRRREVEGG